MSSAPPSTDRSSSRQYISALSILAVALFIGLPVWWKTTEVYRCPLPYNEIMKLQSQQVPPEIVFTISVAVLGDVEQDVVLDKFVAQLQRELVDGSVSARNVRIKTRYIVKDLQLDSAIKSRLLSAVQSNTIEEFSVVVSKSLPSSLGHYTLLLVSSNLVKNGPISEENGASRAFVSQFRHSIILNEKSDLSDSLSAALKIVKGVYGDRKQLEKTLKNTAGLQQERVDVESMRQLRASQGYQLSFTLINPDPSLLRTQWNIKEATNNILLPFLQHPGVASLGNFSVSSQVFYFTDVKFRSRKSTAGPGHYILSSQIPPMISSVESKLASVVSQLPSLNFLVYVPKTSEQPLTIRSSSKSEESTDTFLVPQWGGVVFCNPPEAEANSEPMNLDLVDVQMEKIMPVFVKQLKMLLGIPSDMPVTGGSDSLQFSSGSLGITDWQVDHLLTAKMVESVSMATTSLISLVSLLDKVKNMVISDHIQKEVESSLYAVQKCYQLSARGDLAPAYSLAKQAMSSAETAFFDPSILELLYFPDDQKFAIYIPLFLPISVPILFSSVAALKWLKSSLRTSVPDKTKTD